MYKLIKSAVKIDSREYNTYGIMGESVRIDDISADLGAVEGLVQKCNRLNVAEYQLRDAVEDFLAE